MLAAAGGRPAGSNGEKMQSSNALNDGTEDIAFAIAGRMHDLGVTGLPRNYEIFYEAFSGSNNSLRKALTTLGDKPGQEELDRLAREYFAQNNRDGIVENFHVELASKLEEVVSLLRRGHNSLEKYGVILDRTSEGLTSGQNLSRDVFEKIIGIMSVATNTTIAQGRRLATSIADTYSELSEVKAKLEEYKKLADTDPLTQIWNRRAFDKVIAQIYSDRKAVMFSALILADIDRFKEVNDRHGHPVGDKILQHVARIFRTGVNGGTFIARTGGEEFAIVVEGLSSDAAVELADDLRAIVEKTPFLRADPGKPHEPVTISLGICMASDADGPEDLYAKADRALYASKMEGRNRVSRYPVANAVSQEAPRKNWMIYRSE